MFYFTKHAIEKMDGLGIDKDEVKETIGKGMKWKDEKTGRFHAQQGGVEVVFAKEESDFVVVTVYLAGRIK